MLYFKKSELAETYHVAEKTITNWIKEAKQGKLGLELHEEHGRAWIRNTTKNITLMDGLVEGRKKFRNSRGVKVISPTPDFYKYYNQEQIFDITSNLDIRREIPFQYGYFDGGANYWDKYAKRLADENAPNNLTSARLLLQTNQGYIDHLIRQYKHVNVFDIGPGNAMPVEEFLRHLHDNKKLARYVALDVSPTMLKIAERNVRDWFNDNIPTDTHEVDISYDRFTHLLRGYAIGQSAEDTINIICVLGSTLSNFRNPDGALQAIHDSVNRNDLLLYTLKLDSEASRRYFDFDTVRNIPTLDVKSKMVLDMLSIDESYYDVEIGYDAKLKQRYMRIRLKVALTIEFEFNAGRQTLHINKNEAILVWRSWHLTAQEVIDQFQRNDFDVLQSSLTENKEFQLTVSRVKSER